MQDIDYRIRRSNRARRVRITVDGSGGVEVLVAFFELETQVCPVLLEVGDLLVEGIDVGGSAEA